jgi:hypothetical protein
MSCDDRIEAGMSRLIDAGSCDPERDEDVPRGEIEGLCADPLGPRAVEHGRVDEADGRSVAERGVGEPAR